MSKGERTRSEIIRQAAALFNQQGYAGASIADVMRATELEKGGIYNHFKSKDALAVEAFDYGFGRSSRRMLRYIREVDSPLEQLRRVVMFFEGYYTAPVVPGGCMLLNTAIESDDANPALRQRAQQGMALWRKLIRRIVRQGIAAGEIQPQADPDALATLFIATLEGGVMMSQLYKDVAHVQRVVRYLLDYIDLRVAAG